jgi:hypothetical protein
MHRRVEPMDRARGRRQSFRIRWLGDQPTKGRIHVLSVERMFGCVWRGVSADVTGLVLHTHTRPTAALFAMQRGLLRCDP